MFSSCVLSAHQVIPMDILGEDKDRNFSKTPVTEKASEIYEDWPCSDSMLSLT